MIKNKKNIFDCSECKKHNLPSKKAIAYCETKQPRSLTVKKAAVISKIGMGKNPMKRTKTAKLDKIGVHTPKEGTTFND